MLCVISLVHNNSGNKSKSSVKRNRKLIKVSRSDTVLIAALSDSLLRKLLY